MKPAKKAILGMSLLWMCGCGTMENLVGIVGDNGEREVYGGVVQSIGFGRYTTRGITDVDEVNMLPYRVIAGTYCFVVDAPLSAVADTLTLPITIPTALAHWKNGRPWRIVREDEPLKEEVER